MAWCGIRAARPSTCRLYPLGRLFMSGHDPNQPQNWHYRIMGRCPGFDAPDPGEPTPPGYTPPDPDQTVRDWLQRQLDPEQEAEKHFYVFQVVPAYMQAHLHAPTEDNPDGRLPENLTPGLARVFYTPPPTPADPAHDHAVIMEWLGTLRETALIFSQTVAPIDAGEIRLHAPVVEETA